MSERDVGHERFQIHARDAFLTQLMETGRATVWYTAHTKPPSDIGEVVDAIRSCCDELAIERFRLEAGLGCVHVEVTP